MATQKVFSKNRWIERSSRYDCDVVIQAKTLGSLVGCDFLSINVSSSGLLLGAGANMTPYITNTLLDIKIDPMAEVLPRPITCMGKVVRKENDFIDPGYEVTKYGIMIIQMSHPDLFLWRELLDKLEVKFQENPEENNNILKIEKALATRGRNLPRKDFATNKEEK